VYKDGDVECFPGRARWCCNHPWQDISSKKFCSGSFSHDGTSLFLIHEYPGGLEDPELTGGFDSGYPPLLCSPTPNECHEATGCIAVDSVRSRLTSALLRRPGAPYRPGIAGAKVENRHPDFVEGHKYCHANVTRHPDVFYCTVWPPIDYVALAAHSSIAPNIEYHASSQVIRTYEVNLLRTVSFSDKVIPSSQ